MAVYSLLFKYRIDVLAFGFDQDSHDFSLLSLSEKRFEITDVTLAWVLMSRRSMRRNFFVI